MRTDCARCSSFHRFCFRQFRRGSNDGWWLTACRRFAMLQHGKRYGARQVDRIPERLERPWKTGDRGTSGAPNAIEITAETLTDQAKEEKASAARAEPIRRGNGFTVLAVDGAHKFRLL
jgi:hypothetical protein